MFKNREKYFKSFKMGMQRSMEYRVNFFLGFLSCIFPLIIQFFLWKAIFESSGRDLVYGYRFSQLFLYSVATGIVTKITAQGFQYEVHREIKTGVFSKYLVLPVNFFSMKLFVVLGQKIAEFFIGILMITIVLIIFKYTTDYPGNMINIFPFCLSFIMGIILNFIIFYGVLSLTFTLNDASYFFEVVQIILLVVSGGILPLDIFGERMLSVLKLLPFQYTAYFPINILTGRSSADEIAAGLLLQAFYLVILGVFVNLLWNSSAKKYTTFGG